MHSGTVVQVDGNQLTMSHDDGSPDDVHSVATNAKVTLNGNAAKLSDLQPGDKVQVEGNPATSVRGTR